MKNKMWMTLGCLVVFLCFNSGVTAQAAGPPADAKKHTEAGKYVTSQEAYTMWKSSPETVKIIDCRIPEEYVFVGHAEMAHNIPSKLWTGKYNAEKKEYELQDNPDFELRMKKKFGLGDTLLVMCRSGHRSGASANRLTKAGFTNVYNISDGFEGDQVKDEESSFNGKRMKNGWKNSGMPWTTALDTALLYLPEN